MFGAVASFLTSEIAAALKRKALVYGMLVGAALIVIFAAGYGLNAIYSMIAFRYGSTTASLIIAGALMLAATACVAGAYVMSRRPRPRISVPASPLARLPALPYSRAQVLSALAMVASVVGAGWAVTSYRRRQRMSLPGARSGRAEKTSGPRRLSNSGHEAGRRPARAWLD
jgi:hypothetical protein